MRVATIATIVGFSAKLKPERRVKASSIVNVLNVSASRSSSSSSSAEVGICRIPPKVVRCVEVQRSTPSSSDEVRPSVAHTPRASFQYWQLRRVEQLASRYPAGQAQRPSAHQSGWPEQKPNSRQSPAP